MSTHVAARRGKPSDCATSNIADRAFKMLFPAETAYRHLMQQRRRRFSAAPLRVQNCVIVSVGNLSTGGTGKTPCVQWIARHFQERGARVAVVARGYGGTLSSRGAIVSDGERVYYDAREAGDEPMLHARALPGIAVVIGRNRIEAAKRAVAECGAQVVVLDDGFQFWSLARDFDLVLLDARRPFGNGHLLPHGRLREEAASLGRATAVGLTRADQASPDELSLSREQVEALSDAPIFEARHRPIELRRELEAGSANRERQSLESLRGARVVALSALADNATFAAMLRDLGANVVSHVAKSDHHSWHESEVLRAAQAAQSNNAVLVTTEKDAVKMRAATLSVALWSLSVALQITKGEDHLRAMLDRLIA